MTIRLAATAYLPKWPEKVISCEWTGLLNGDEGSKMELPSYPDRSLQVSGTFGTGGNLQLQGSNNGIDWVPLNDPQGNVLNITSGKIESIQELARYMKPVVTAGDGDTSLTVTMIIRRA